MAVEIDKVLMVKIQQLVVNELKLKTLETNYFIMGKPCPHTKSGCCNECKDDFTLTNASLDCEALAIERSLPLYYKLYTELKPRFSSISLRSTQWYELIAKASGMTIPNSLLPVKK